MKITKEHKVIISLSNDEIDDMVRILYIAYERFSGENRIDKGHSKTPYTSYARESACKLIESMYNELPCDWEKSALHG